METFLSISSQRMFEVKKWLEDKGVNRFDVDFWRAIDMSKELSSQVKKGKREFTTEHKINCIKKYQNICPLANPYYLFIIPKPEKSKVFAPK